MTAGRKIRVGIGFATGRKNFQRVLRTNIFTWKESGLVENQNVSLNLFVAYDLNYSKTKRSDYTKINPELAKNIDSRYFLGAAAIRREMDLLVAENVLSEEEARLIFCGGYAAKRNILQLSAIKNGMDYLIFLDDDEYPMAVTNTRGTLVWGGQHVLHTHLKHISQADITHGHHCGYISPIPYVEYNDKLSENDFRNFIEAISNDIVGWDTIKTVMGNGGVTYADPKVLTSNEAYEVPEINRAKFISGANLCVKLSDPHRVFPFYNPPGARGEDTFLSTCLTGRTVLRVPCYTFHDGFSTYKHLLHGVLPLRFKFIRADQEAIVTRFYKACIGWMRYKPLLLYITHPESYAEMIDRIRRQLVATLPKICDYFGQRRFMNILTELEEYNKSVEVQAREFEMTRTAWARIMAYFAATEQKPAAFE
jgi:hypothetical protein